MQESKHPQIEKLKKKLKKYTKNKQIIDIFLIGSSIKEKIEPKDIDLIILFKDKNYEEIQETIYKIKEELSIENLHTEPLIAENLFKEKIFPTILHEGISIKHDKSIAELTGYKPYLLFTFSLKKLTKINKVRFAQTIYGRKDKGILQKEGGKTVGKGAFLAPIEKEHLFRDIMNNFKVEYNIKRVMVKY